MNLSVKVDIPEWIYVLIDGLKVAVENGMPEEYAIDIIKSHTLKALIITPKTVSEK